MWLVVGLGNPGRRYEDTRHNVGFRVLEEVARRWDVPLDRKEFGARTGAGAVAGDKALLAEPQAFMNLSGGPVSSLRGFYRLEVDRVLVIHDDLDLPFGTVRVKERGGHGGHNGLRDLLRHLGEAFPRVRVGVSRPPPEWDSADYVLARWSDSEREHLDEVVQRAADAVEHVVRHGVPAAMNSYNVRPRASGTDGGGGPPSPPTT